MNQPQPCELIAAYFTGIEADRAARALRAYFAPDLHFTGSAFDGLLDHGTPDRFTAIDMLAVTTLSVEVPPRAAIRLIESPDVEPLLAAIPTTADLWSDLELLHDDSHADRLWKLVRSHDGIGRTITSKLLAAKRPHLIPIYDQHVQAALGFDNQWPFMLAVARSPKVTQLLIDVGNSRTAAGVPAEVSVLRIIDIVIWMRQHGWHSHDTSNCACDFTGFQLALGEAA
jgi:hypothetical protein